MATYDLAIRNGIVVTAEGRAAADVGVVDGRIETVGVLAGSARREIDVAGRFVLPGAIDSHCHVDQKSSTGLMTADDFFSASVSAACGGVTTMLSFAAQHRGQRLEEVVADYHARASGRAVIDYGFHLIVSDPTPDVLERELPVMVDAGCTSLKVFMAYDALRLTDAQILDVLAVARRERALVMVHAENQDLIAWTTRRLIAAGHTAPRFHAESRPAVAEREAIHRMICLTEATGASLLVVHVSGAEALAPIREARTRGVPVFAETCPQYLVLTAGDLDREGFEGAKFVFSPPPRDRQSHDALWTGLQDRVIDVVSSDHAPYPFSGAYGKAAHGVGAAFPQIPSGVPGLETCQPVMFEQGVQRGRLTLEQFVAVSATNAARIYGIYPKKGTIAVGADADLVIWDQAPCTIANDRLHHHMDYTPYEGMRVSAWPSITISRGDVIWMDGRVSAPAGRGQFLRRPRLSLTPDALHDASTNSATAPLREARS